MTLHFQSTMSDSIDQMADTDNQNVPLSGTVKSMLEDYFNDLDGHPPADLYQMVLQEIEQPLLETVLHYTRGNQSKAAVLLGLNRGTLRKKLKQYDIN
jgi:Fis family transcriptional regulator